MKLKDVNTTDLYATDRNELGRVVMTGQLWKRDNFNRDPFPFRHVSGTYRQGRVGEGYHGMVVGHLTLVHWGTITADVRRELAEVELPVLDSDTSYDEQRAVLEALLERLEDTDFRLVVANTQRMKPWADYEDAQRQQRETWEREQAERRARQAAVHSQFDQLAGTLGVYVSNTVYLRNQVGYKAWSGDVPTVTLPLDVLQRILADAARTRT